MSINFSFNSFDNSTQNNTITINNNDIDKILEVLKEVNLSLQDILELKLAIENDKDEVKTTNTLGKNVRKWCLSIFDKVSTGLIVNVSLTLIKAKISDVLSAVYQFPIQF
jgi:citrate lyase synthetase